MNLTRRSLQHLIRQVLQEADYSRLVQSLDDGERELSPRDALAEIYVIVLSEDPTKETLEELFEYGELGMQYVISHPEEFEEGEVPSEMLRTIDKLPSMDPNKAWERIEVLAANTSGNNYEDFQTLRKVVDIGFQAYMHLMEQGEN